MRHTPDYIVSFAPGPPVFVPALGMLPGPPTVLEPLVPGLPTLFVDDRNAGEDLSCGRHGAHAITTTRALGLLRRQLRAPTLGATHRPSEAPQNASPPTDPVTSLRQAAKLLRVGRTTLSKRIAALSPEQRPTNSGTPDRPRWWWPSTDACLAWWQEVNAVAGPTSVAVAPASTPVPPAPSRSGGPSLQERLAALQHSDED